MANLKAATAEKERIGTELSLAARIQADMEEMRHENISGINSAGFDVRLFEGGHTRIGAASSRCLRS